MLLCLKFQPRVCWYLPPPHTHTLGVRVCGGAVWYPHTGLKSWQVGAENCIAKGSLAAHGGFPSKETPTHTVARAITDQHT